MLADLVLPSGLFPWQADGCVFMWSYFCVLYVLVLGICIFKEAGGSGRGPEWFLSTLVCQEAFYTGHVATEIGATENPNVCQVIQCSVNTM